MHTAWASLLGKAATDVRRHHWDAVLAVLTCGEAEPYVEREQHVELPHAEPEPDVAPRRAEQVLVRDAEQRPYAVQASA
jgi:hypothetical protein